MSVVAEGILLVITERSDFVPVFYITGIYMYICRQNGGVGIIYRAPPAH